DGDAGQRDARAARELEEHAGSGFAAFTAGAGAVRAEEDRLHGAAELGEMREHLLVDGVEIAHGELAAGQPRLVGYHHDAPPGPAQAPDGLEAPRDGDPFLLGPDVLHRVEIDDA